MFQIPEQFASAGKAQLEAQLNLINSITNRAIEQVEKVIALQLSTSQAALASSSSVARQLLDAKDAREWLATSASQAAPAIENLLSYSRQLFSLAASAQSDLAAGAKLTTPFASAAKSYLRPAPAPASALAASPAPAAAADAGGQFVTPPHVAAEQRVPVGKPITAEASFTQDGGNGQKAVVTSPLAPQAVEQPAAASAEDITAAPAPAPAATPAAEAVAVARDIPDVPELTVTVAPPAPPKPIAKAIDEIAAKPLTSTMAPVSADVARDQADEVPVVVAPAAVKAAGNRASRSKPAAAASEPKQDKAAVPAETAPKSKPRK
jgi:phasin family protein